MKRALVVALPLVLGGCGAGTVAGVALYTLEGSTFVVSGRTMSDHIISAMMEKDCKVYRVIKDEVVCREFEQSDETFLVALVKTWKDDISSTYSFAVADLGIDEKSYSAPAAQTASAALAETQTSSAAVVAAVAAEPAAGAADRLCKLIGETPIPASVDGSSVSIVVSIGVASAKAGTQILDELLKRADTALYQAKNNGRNQVVAVSESGDVMSDNKKVANG